MRFGAGFSEVCDLWVRDRGILAVDDSDRHVREIAGDPRDDRCGGIPLVVQAEDDLEIGVLLVAKRRQAFVQTGIGAVERLEDGDARRFGSIGYAAPRETRQLVKRERKIRGSGHARDQENDQTASSR